MKQKKNYKIMCTFTLWVVNKPETSNVNIITQDAGLFWTLSLLNVEKSVKAEFSLFMNFI